MNIITWHVDDMEQTIGELDNLVKVNRLKMKLSKGDTEDFELNDVIAFLKHSLMGEYHGILVREDYETIDESEVYLLTWDGEASEGGHMIRVDIDLLKQIYDGNLNFLEK